MAVNANSYIAGFDQSLERFLPGFVELNVRFDIDEYIAGDG